jgi:hypothetical protein
LVTTRGGPEADGVRETALPTVTTIVTCMTDAERAFLPAALESVRLQTRPCKLVLCVDESNAWIDEVLTSTGLDMELLRLPLASAAAIRNRAIARVNTLMVAFLDGDDVWSPTKLQRQIDVLTRHDLDVVASKHVLIREDGTPFFFGFARSIPMTSSWLGWTSAFRDRPFEHVAVGEDVLLWKRLEAEVRTQVIDAFLLRYRVRPTSLSEGTPSKRRKDAYERRSHRPGMRPLLLGTSYSLNLGLRAVNSMGRS